MYFCLSNLKNLEFWIYSKSKMLFFQSWICCHSWAWCEKKDLFFCLSFSFLLSVTLKTNKNPKCVISVFQHAVKTLIEQEQLSNSHSSLLNCFVHNKSSFIASVLFWARLWNIFGIHHGLALWSHTTEIRISHFINQRNHNHAFGPTLTPPSMFFLWKKIRFKNGLDAPSQSNLSDMWAALTGKKNFQPLTQWSNLRGDITRAVTAPHKEAVGSWGFPPPAWLRWNQAAGIICCVVRREYTRS